MMEGISFRSVLTPLLECGALDVNLGNNTNVEFNPVTMIGA